MQNSDKFDTELEDALYNLEIIIPRLNRESQLLIPITLVNLLITLFTFSFFSLSGVDRNIINYIILISILCVMFIMLIAYRFDALRRDGNAYFEELSDELHGSKIKEKNESYKNDISLKARIIIRRYSNATSVPLIPGKYGPAIIVIINILCSFLTASITSSFLRHF